MFPDLEVVLLPQLRERDLNELEGKPSSLVEQTRREAPHQKDGDEGIFRVAGVENLSSMVARAEDILRQIKEADTRRVFVVGQGAFINCLVNILSPAIQTGHTLDDSF